MLKRVLQRFMRPTYLVGRDLEGNKYYEFPNAEFGRPKRTVQYTRSNDMWAYVASGKRLPVQWNAWLTHTRSDPPSIEELKADVARLHRVQMKVAMLAAEERASTARLGSQLSSSRPQVTQPPLENEPERERDVPPVDAPSGGGPTDPWAEASRGSDQPESWNPVARRR